MIGPSVPLFTLEKTHAEEIQESFITAVSRVLIFERELVGEETCANTRTAYSNVGCIPLSIGQDCVKTGRAVIDKCASSRTLKRSFDLCMYQLDLVFLLRGQHLRVVDSWTWLRL